MAATTTKDTANLSQSVGPVHSGDATLKTAPTTKHSTDTTQLRTIRAPPEHLVEGDLILRRWQFSDADALRAAASGSLVELSRWMPWAAEGYDLAKAQQFLDFTNKAWDTGDEYDFAIIVNGQVSGSFGIMQPGSKLPHALEIGYWLANEATGRGLATRATALLTRIAFEIGAEHVQIRHDELNDRSAAIPRRLDFTCLGIHNLPVRKDGAEVKSVLWQTDRDGAK